MTKPIIIYDDACPMCKLYTAGFEKAGWVHRTGFSKASEQLKAQLDLDRARHEIPLYDAETGEVRYGMEALFNILGARFPLLNPLFAFPPFRWFIYGLYQIITYNRRVIAGSAPPSEGFDCAPDRHVGMRVLYITLAAVASLLLLLKMTLTAPIFLVFAALHGALLLFGLLTKNDTLDFVGHWVTVLLASVALCTFSPFVGVLGAAFLWWKRGWVLMHN